MGDLRQLLDSRLQSIEVGAGAVEDLNESAYRLAIPKCRQGYTNAQIDDYSANQRGFPNRQGVVLTLEACFSHAADRLQGTAGFGFWNAAYGDVRRRLPRLPQAAWFFFASQPNDLPFAAQDGRGWFASVIDTPRPRHIPTFLSLPFLWLPFQFPRIRRNLWPKTRRALGIRAAAIETPMQTWNHYQIEWLENGCTLSVNHKPVLQTTLSPRGPLGFVCWLDNQYLIATPTGRLRAGTLPTTNEQQLTVRNLTIHQFTNSQTHNFSS